MNSLEKIGFTERELIRIKYALLADIDNRQIGGTIHIPLNAAFPRSQEEIEINESVIAKIREHLGEL